MRKRVIDGDHWIAERLKFLRRQLDGDVSDEQRQAIESEIEVLGKERGLHSGTPRLLWFPTRWIGRLWDKKVRRTY